MAPLQDLSSGVFRVSGHPSPILRSSFLSRYENEYSEVCPVSGDWRKGFNPDEFQVGDGHHRRGSGHGGDSHAMRNTFQAFTKMFCGNKPESTFYK